jgi:pimeloyl-ACP methyl ester carboxylesterase
MDTGISRIETDRLGQSRVIARGGSARAGAAAVTKRAPFVEAPDGTELFVRDWGVGKPVLFVHSWGMSSDMWQYQMVELAGRGCRCIAYDRRGHGRSSDPGRGYDYDTLADDLACVIDELDLTELTLIGHSMSGGEIIRYVTRHGAERVARIALLGPTLPFLTKTQDNPQGVEASYFEAVRASWRRDITKWVAENEAPFFVPESSPGMRRWLVGLLGTCSLQAALECNRAAAETDFRAELPAIPVPTLILHGDKDASVPHAFSERTARLMPDCRLKVYEGAPHGLFITHMERVNADLAAFIEV